MKTAREFRENYDKFIWAPFKWCTEAIVSFLLSGKDRHRESQKITGQSNPPNLVAKNINRGEADNEILAAAASDTIAGGLDTVCSLGSFSNHVHV